MPTHKLFDRFKLERKADALMPRQYADYAVALNDRTLPQRVILTRATK